MEPAGRDPLPIKSLVFLGGMASPDGWRPPPELPEIAFAGRSNVGKSSLLNRLVRRKKFARESNTPGRTREINFFKVNDQFVFVDLPGYGYARVSKEQRGGWRVLLEAYVRNSPQLRGIVQLLDVRRDPVTEDEQMLEFLADLGAPTVFALTKIDKLPVTQRADRIRELSRRLGLDADQVVPFSAVSNEGRDEIAAAVAALLAQPSWRDTSNVRGAI